MIDIDDDKSGQRAFQVGALLVASVLGIALYHYYHPESKTTESIASCSLPSGNFEIIPRDGRLNAVNTETGMKLGVPERWADGQIMITANGGRMINATACLGQHSSWFALKEPTTQAR